jgi:hypothetical protein
MLATIQDNRQLRKRLTITVVLLMIPISYWPGGEILEGALSPQMYFLWVVIGLPALLVVTFTANAYLNIQEDERLEEQERDVETTVADGGDDS